MCCPPPLPPLLALPAGIDDSLNLLLDDLKQEDGLALPGSTGGQVRKPVGVGRWPPVSARAPEPSHTLSGTSLTLLWSALLLQGLTPLAGQWSLGADALVTATIASGGAAGLKGGGGGGGGGGGEQQPPQLAPGFAPVPLPAKLRLPGSGGKVQLGSSGLGGLEEGSPSLQLHPSAGGSSFAIHAFGRPLTQLDFISTGGCAARNQMHTGMWRPLYSTASSDNRGWLLTGLAGQVDHRGCPLPASLPCLAHPQSTPFRPLLWFLSATIASRLSNTPPADDIDDEQLPPGPNPRSAAPPAAGDALFGSLGDAGRMGSGLPLSSLEDLRRMAFDPSPLTNQLPDPMAIGGGGGSGGYLSSSAAFMGLPAPGQLGLIPSQPAAPHSLYPAASAAPFGSYSSGGAAGEEAPHPLLRPALLRVRTAELGGSGQYSGGVRATSLSPVTGNLKRRLDGLGLGESDVEGSPHGMKRHSSGSLWSEGSADNDGDTPRSSTPRGGQSGGQAWAGMGRRECREPVPWWWKLMPPPVT